MSVQQALIQSKEQLVLMIVSHAPQEAPLEVLGQLNVVRALLERML